jgi:zinc protease
MEGKAAALAAAEALDDFSFLDREYAALEQVGPAQVREVAARYLRPDNAAGVAYLPSGEGTELTRDLLERSFAVTSLKEPSGQMVPPRSIPPAQPTPGRTQAGVMHTALAGADLLVRRKPGVPLVTLGVYVPRSEFDPPAEAGLGALTVRSSVRGAGDLDTGELAFAFERLGGTLSASLASDWLGFATTVLAEHLGEAATLLQQVLEQPKLGNEDIATERDLMVVEAEQVADDMFRYPFQLGFAAAFGDSAYGLPVSGLPHTLAAIAPARVRGWHDRVLLGARPVVIAVGDMEPEQASATLAGVFQDRPSHPDRRLFAPVPWVGGSNGNGSKVVQREKAQAALAMIFPGPSRRAPDRGAGEVWAAVASGLGGRMFEALRDRRSLAYTVLASSWQRGRAGALVTYIATSPQREEEARAAMLEELQRFSETPVSETELLQAVNYLSGQAEVGRQSGASLAAEILEAWLIGNGLGDLEDPAALFRGVTAADVSRVARDYLQPLARAEGVVRGTGVSQRVGG